MIAGLRGRLRSAPGGVFGVAGQAHVELEVWSSREKTQKFSYRRHVCGIKIAKSYRSGATGICDGWWVWENAISVFLESWLRCYQARRFRSPSNLDPQHYAGSRSPP